MGRLEGYAMASHLPGTCRGQTAARLRSCSSQIGGSGLINTRDAGQQGHTVLVWLWARMGHMEGLKTSLQHSGN